MTLQLSPSQHAVLVSLLQTACALRVQLLPLQQRLKMHVSLLTAPQSHSSPASRTPLPQPLLSTVRVPGVWKHVPVDCEREQICVADMGANRTGEPPLVGFMMYWPPQSQLGEHALHVLRDGGGHVVEMQSWIEPVIARSVPSDRLCAGYDT